MTRKILVLFLIGSIATSCVPKKDLVYFQGEPVPNTEIYKIANEPYKLQVNDILDIRIKADDQERVNLFNRSLQSGAVNANQIGEEQLYFNSYTIDRLGNIRIPYLNEINVLGYTEAEVREKIEKKLMTFFNDIDDLFVTVKLAGIRFTVLGEVSRTGSLVLYQNQVNVVEAIANSGDILITGNRKRVQIIRKNIDSTRKFVIDLTSIDTFNSEGFYIQSNDIIYVEPLKQKSWGTGATGAQSFATIISVLSLLTTSVLLIKNL